MHCNSIQSSAMATWVAAGENSLASDSVSRLYLESIHLPAQLPDYE